MCSYSLDVQQENKQFSAVVNAQRINNMYGLEFTFLKQLKDSPYITTNPEEADYFYYVAYLYYGDNKDMHAMLADMRRQGPYLDRNQGADHIFVVTDGRRVMHLFWQGFGRQPFCTAACFVLHGHLRACLTCMQVDFVPRMAVACLRCVWSAGWLLHLFGSAGRTHVNADDAPCQWNWHRMQANLCTQ